MNVLYTIFVSLLIFVMKIGAFFSYKMKRGLAGRRQSCKIVQEKISPHDRVIWMHAASLGEYEQGLPVLEQLKEHFPDHKVLITFFSPSGYENVMRRKPVADAVCYLPFDRQLWAENFVKLFHTDIFFTVKYDYWYHILAEIKKQGARMYVVSAYFYETQIFFKPYGKWFVKQLMKDIDWFFHQTKQSTALAKGLGLEHSSTAGDTRFDRVKKRLSADNFLPCIEAFKEDKKTLVFGSAWQTEERLAEIIAKKHKDVKIIIAPHDLARVSQLKEVFPQALLYSEISEEKIAATHPQVLIVDSVGQLSRLYAYADLAVVGGGFHSAGLHNILEAAVFSIPVIFGNQYRKNPEADALIASKGGKAFEDEFYASQYIDELLKFPEMMSSMGAKAGEFVQAQPNSTQIIMEKILRDFSLSRDPQKLS